MLFFRFRGFKNQRKIDPKVEEKTSINGFRKRSHVHPSARPFLGAPWAPLGAVLGSSWRPWWPSCSVYFFFTASWARLGAVLAPSWTLWVALRTFLGTPWKPPGASWGTRLPHRAHQDAIRHKNQKSSPRCSESLIFDGPALQVSIKNR